MNRYLYLLSLVMAISGCATKYVAPKGIGTSNFEITHLGDIPSSTSVNIFSKPECSKKNNLGKIADVGRSITNWNASITVKIEAESEKFIAVNQWWEDVYYGSKTAHYCTNFIGFKPALGATYTIKQMQLPEGSCRVEILNKANNLPPPDLKIYKANKFCDQ